jgi:hypothetical protein
MSNTVSRVVKGGRTAFFENAESDRLLAMLMQLVTEHWAVRERTLVLERLLVDKGVLEEGELDAYRPDADRDAAWDAMSFELMQAVIEAGQNIERR